MAESLEALHARSLARDLAIYRLYGAAQVIAEGRLESILPGHALRSLQDAVAKCRAELDALDTPEVALTQAQEAAQ